MHDFNQQMFAECVPILRDWSGKPEKQVRAVIAKFGRQYGPERVINAVRSLDTYQPESNVIGYIHAVLMKSSQENRGSIKQGGRVEIYKPKKFRQSPTERRKLAEKFHALKLELEKGEGQPLAVELPLAGRDE